MANDNVNVPPPNHVMVLDGQGWIGLVDQMGTETSIVNAAREAELPLPTISDAEEATAAGMTARIAGRLTAVGSARHVTRVTGH